jgi:hypothetical protein
VLILIHPPSQYSKFNEALTNLGKVLKRCHETNISLSHEKCHMLLMEVIVIGHHISPLGIKVDPTKIEVISKLPIPKNKKHVHIFLGHVGYYRRFIEKIVKITSPLFPLLKKT